MTNLIASTIVHGSEQGDAHGHLYLINLTTGQVLRPVSWNRLEIDWRGESGDRGLRGIELVDDRLFVATTSSILELDSEFHVAHEYENQYLRDCSDLSAFGEHLFVGSRSYDSVLGLNVNNSEFDWGMKVVTDGVVFRPSRFDPQTDGGPLMLEKLRLDSVVCTKGGMCMSGTQSKVLLKFGGKTLGIVATLPTDSRNAQPLDDGILFHDTGADVIRIDKASSRRVFPLPHTANPGSGRGLCVLSEKRIVAGSAPAMLAIYNSEDVAVDSAIGLSNDSNEHVHSVREWPHAWPAAR